MGPEVANCASYPLIFFGFSRPDADVHIESLYRACCHLVPLAVAAVVAASTQRFGGLYMYLVAAAVLIGLVIVAAIAMAP
jgi:hypothetical protein